MFFRVTPKLVLTFKKHCTLLTSFKLLLYFMRMSILPVCMCVHHVHAVSAYGSQKKASDPLELDLQAPI